MFYKKVTETILFDFRTTKNMRDDDSWSAYEFQRKSAQALKRTAFQ